MRAVRITCSAIMIALYGESDCCTQDPVIVPQRRAYMPPSNVLRGLGWELYVGDQVQGIARVRVG